MSETTDLIKNWLSSQTCKEDRDRAAKTADCDLTNAINALGKRMLPKSMEKNSENAAREVCAWVPLNEREEQMLVIKKSSRMSGSGDYDIRFVGEKRDI